MTLGAAEAAASRPPTFDSRAVRIWCGALLAGYAALWFGAAFLPLQDFAILWAAGRLAALGRAAAAYDLAAMRAIWPPVKVAFPYPPFFLLVLAPLGLLPFAAAATVWLAATVGCYVAAIRAILPGPTAAIAALAFPTVLIDVAWGQNGLLLAALLGAGLALLERRPLLAGVLIGCMAYKPHYGVLLPLFLAVTGRWRSFAAAAATVLALPVLAGALFGWSSYADFAALGVAANTDFAHGRLATMVAWSDLVSAHALLRALGCSAAVAWSAHIAFAAAAAVLSLGLAAGKTRDSLKFAALAAAIVLIPPYSEPADWSLLAVAVAFLVRDGVEFGLRRWERLALVAVFALPLADLMLRPALHAVGLVPLWFAGPLMCGILAAIIGGRSRHPRLAAGRQWR